MKFCQNGDALKKDGLFSDTWLTLMNSLE
jgi:hypothetical protein